MTPIDKRFRGRIMGGMKKILVVLAILALPVVSIAQINRQAGIEYLTPLVQQIIGLLQERIFILQSELNACRAGNTDIQKVKNQIFDKQRQLELARQERISRDYEFKQLGSKFGVLQRDAYDRFVKENDITQLRLESEIRLLEAELNRIK